MGIGWGMGQQPAHSYSGILLRYEKKLLIHRKDMIES